MYCVMRVSAPSLCSAYRRYDEGGIWGFQVNHELSICCMNVYVYTFFNMHVLEASRLTKNSLLVIQYTTHARTQS